MTELARRTLTAVIAAPLALAILYVGDWALAALLAVVSALAARELFNMAEHRGVRPLVGVGMALAGILPLLVHAHFRGVFTTPLVVGPVLVLAVLALAIWQRGVDGRPLAAVAVTIFGVIYTGGMFSYGYLLRYDRYTIPAEPLAGTALVAFPVVLTWVSDIGAYFVGRALGRRKLIPSVSPGKTVAGAIGALVACAVVSPLYVRWVLGPAAQLGMTVGRAIVFGVIISIAAQLGDLAESLLKREAGVKDSSHLIPGHGGVLDRLDAMIFTLPVAYLLLDRLFTVPR